MNRDFRVCLVGNMNNNNYILAKMLREMGIEADLVLLGNEYKYFLPEFYNEELKNGYPDWIRKVRWGSGISFFFTSKNEILKDLKGYDLYIACNTFSPAFLYKAGLIERTIIRPHGCDIYMIPFWRKLLKNCKFYAKVAFPLIYRISQIQRVAIKKCLAICCLPIGPLYESLQKLNVLDKVVKFGVLIDTSFFNSYKIKEITTLHQHQDDVELIIFSPTRHVWYKNSIKKCPEADKGNNILIEGFASFLKNEKVSALLILVRKGPDVIFSQKLIHKLNLSQNVKWLPEISLNEMVHFYHISDIVADQFKYGFYGSIGVEAMAVGKPLLTYINKEHIRKLKLPEPPCISAKRGEEVSFALEDYYENKNKYRFLSENAKKWVEKYHGRHLLKEFVRLFNYLLEGKPAKEFSPSLY